MIVCFLLIGIVILQPELQQLFRMQACRKIIKCRILTVRLVFRAQRSFDNIYCQVNRMEKPNPAFLYPPSHEKALRHRKANQIFKGLTASDTQICQCCGRKIGSGPISTSCMMDPNQLAFLGPGVPLFFLFLRMSILLLLSLSIIFSAFSIYSNLVTGDCTTYMTCTDKIVSKMSLINKKSDSTYMAIQCYLQLAFIVLGVGLFQWLRASGNRLKQQCDEVVDSPSDYAVILRRLPPGTTVEDIEEMIGERRKELTPEERAITEELKVVTIVLSFSLREYLKIHNENAEKFKIAIKQQRHHSFTPQPVPTPSIPSSIAIIVFQHQSSKKFFIHQPNTFQRFLQGLCTPCIPIGVLKVKGQPIGIQRAPQPDDISWQNSGITMSGAILRRFFYGSLSILILLLGGAAQYGLELLYNSTSNSTLQTFLFIFNSILILAFNWIIWMTLVFTTKRQRTETLAQYSKVLMVKLAIFQFFNAGVFVVAAEVLAKSSVFSLNDGICQQIMLIMAINCLTPNLTLLVLNYTEVVNKVWIKLGDLGILTFTQKQLNELYLSPQVDLPSRYAYVLKIIWLTGFYAPLVPIVVVIAVGGLGVNYLVEKLLWCKVYSVPNTVSSMGYETAVQLLEYFLVAFSLGQLVSYFYLYNFQLGSIPTQWLIPIFLSLALAGVHFLLPMDTINEMLFPIVESAKSMAKYSEVEQKFEVTYQMNNPAYKTGRVRKNVKDILGLGVGEEESKIIAIEMANMLNPSLIGQEENPISRQPLLQEGQEKHEGEAKQQNQGGNGGILAGLISIGNNEDQRPLQNSITNDPKSNPLQAAQQNRLKNMHHSTSTANDSILPKPLTNQPQPQPLPPPKSLNKQPSIIMNESFQGGDGQKINVSIHQPPELKRSKRSQVIPSLEIITDDEPMPIKTKNKAANSSTKYKKMPEIPPLIIPPRKQEQKTDNNQEGSKKQEKAIKNDTKQHIQKQPKPQSKPEQQQYQPKPFKNPFDDAPIAIKAPPASSLPSQASQTSSGIQPGTFNPAPLSEHFRCFADPQMQKQAIYNPYNFPQRSDPSSIGPNHIPSRAHLTGQGLMKVLGRPFGSFLTKLSIEGMTQRRQKKMKK